MAVGGSALAICWASAPGTPGTGPTTLWPPQPTTGSLASISAICSIKENIKVITWGGGTARVTQKPPILGGDFGRESVAF